MSRDSDNPTPIPEITVYEPVMMRAVVDFQSYCPDELGLEQRVERCITTHPTLSFGVEAVTVDRLMPDDNDKVTPITFHEPPSWMAETAVTPSPLDLDRDEAIRRLRETCRWGLHTSQSLIRLIAEGQQEAGANLSVPENVVDAPPTDPGDSTIAVGEPDGPMHLVDQLRTGRLTPTPESEDPS